MFIGGQFNSYTASHGRGFHEKAASCQALVWLSGAPNHFHRRPAGGAYAPISPFSLEELFGRIASDADADQREAHDSLSVRSPQPPTRPASIRTLELEHFRSPVPAGVHNL